MYHPASTGSKAIRGFDFQVKVRMYVLFFRTCDRRSIIPRIVNEVVERSIHLIDCMRVHNAPSRTMRWLLLFGLITHATCLVSPLATRKYSSHFLSSSALFVARPQKQTSQTPINDDVNGKRSGYSTGKRYSQYLDKRNGPFPRFRLFRRTKEEDQSTVADDSDGYDDMMNKKRGILRRAIKAPFRVMKRIFDPPGEPGTYVRECLSSRIMPEQVIPNTLLST
jgi:hypothetical protein